MSDFERKTKDRSPNYPFIPLDVALDRAAQFYAKEKKGAAPLLVAASHWGYSPSSSGFLQTIAALKSYGLMSDEGSGSERTVRLTELALRILLDQRPDSSERAQYMRDAALAPPVMRDIYSKFENNLPSEPTLRHFLVFNLSFNNNTASRLARIIFRNQRFTGQISSENEEQTEEFEEDKIQKSEPSEVQPVQPISAKPTQPSTIKMERIIAPDAEVLIQFSGDPTWDTYDFIEKYVSLRKAVLKKEQP